MTYRDDLDALIARHAALQAELGQKQRELAEVAGMLAEASRVKQAERYFERAPDLRRRQRRHLAIAALVVTLGTGAALGAAVSAAKQSHRAAAAQMEARLVRILSTQAERTETQRLQAELEALRALRSIPIDLDELEKPRGRARDQAIECRIPAHRSPPSASPAGEDER